MIMETIIPDTIQNKPEFLSRVEQANQFVQTDLGDFAGEVKAEWNLVEDQQGRPLLELTLSDWSGKVQDRFSLPDFDKIDSREKRLRRLWDNLLEMRNREQFKQLKRLIDQL